MGWMIFFRFTKFKYATLSALLLLLEGYYYHSSFTIPFCIEKTSVCYFGARSLLVYNMTKILPIMISAYLLLCLGQFLFNLYSGISSKKNIYENK